MVPLAIHLLFNEEEMNLEDLKDEIVSHLAEMSNLRVGKAQETVKYGVYHSNTPNDDDIIITTWSIYEDTNKAESSEWIEKDCSGDCLGEVILEETKLYFQPGYKPKDGDASSIVNYNTAHGGEKIFLGDLVAPDSFEKAIKVLSHALKVLNICKPPKGVGQFGSMTPQNMPGFPKMPWN